MVIYHNVSGSTSWSVTTPIPMQKDSTGKYKTLSIPYFVYEKAAPCRDYPPDGKVTFSNIKMYCNNQLVADPKWTTAYVDDVCDNRANVVDPQTIDITWNTKAADPAPEVIKRSQNNKKFGRPAPVLRGH